MAIEIRVPEFGESVVEATVGHWLKSEGDAVTAGEPVVELETEKVNTTVAADEAGVLTRILHKEGETVHPGEVLGLIEVGATAATAGAETRPQGVAPAPAKQGTQAPAVPAEASPADQTKPSQAPPVSSTTAPSIVESKARVSPVAQRLAAELQVDLAKVQGSGPSGRVMREDVEEAYARDKQQAPPPPSTTPPGQPAPPPAASQALPEAGLASDHRETRRRLSRRRLTIARRLVEAHLAAAMLTTFNEIDMSAVVELRGRRRQVFRETTGVDLGYMSFFVKATMGALKAFPQVNAELRGDELVLKHYYDIGIAIGDPEGLVVPVLREADRLTFAQIEGAIGAFVRKAKERTLSLEELVGGTFTITNGGVFGSLFSTPMLNPPQVGILGMHKMAERPMAVNGQVVIRPTMYVALTYDHRVVDGRDAVLFLVKIKELIEDPERLLLEA